MNSYHVRRTDRAITDPEAIVSILKRGQFTTISMVHDGEPYLVTLSYGYDEAANALFFHTGVEGRKLDAIKADPRVCATVIIDGGYAQTKCEHAYESVVFTGRMSLVTDLDEARAGMRVLLGHLEDEPQGVWDRNRLDSDTRYDRMRVARLDIEHITGKAGK